MTTRKIPFRNGDWNFTQVERMREGTKIKCKNIFVFSKSPVTGNQHEIFVEKDNIEVIQVPNGAYCISFKSDLTVKHQEHSTKNDLIIPPGIYMLTQRQEKDWFTLSTRKVID